MNKIRKCNDRVHFGIVDTEYNTLMRKRNHRPYLVKTQSGAAKKASNISTNGGRAGRFKVVKVEIQYSFQLLVDE